jgi:putative endopeptidase
MKIKIGILLLGATMLFNSCENKPELVSGISKENMNLKVRPGNNFEEYVNGTWLKNNKIPADKSSYGVFDMLIDKSQKDVKEIIEEHIENNRPVERLRFKRKTS